MVLDYGHASTALGRTMAAAAQERHLPRYLSQNKQSHDERKLGELEVSADE